VTKSGRKQGEQFPPAALRREDRRLGRRRGATAGQIQLRTRQDPAPPSRGCAEASRAEAFGGGSDGGWRAHPHPWRGRRPARPFCTASHTVTVGRWPAARWPSPYFGRSITLLL